MKFLTLEDARKWCTENDVALNERGLPFRLPNAVQFDIPSDAGQRVALVKSQLEHFQDCKEILIWINDWSVWESGERIHIFYRFRQSYGEKRLLKEIPAHLMTGNEFEEGISIATLAVLFLWDCYILTKENQKFCFYSHDEFGLILNQQK